MGLAEILFAYQYESPFIRSDMEILSSHFSVEGLQCGGGSQLRSLIYRGARSKVIFSWFALGYATFAAAISRLGGPPSVLVTGGWDVAVVPEISYGIMLSPKRRWKVAFALSFSDRVLAISQAIAADVKRWAPRSRVLVCPLGFDSDKFRPSGLKERKVLTVGNVNQENMMRKGFRTFLHAARSMPDVEFVLAGKVDPKTSAQLHQEVPTNLIVTGFLEQDRLIEEMQSAKVYAQLSAHEGFGCALAEAMLCECIPVVTDRGAMPEVVGDSGFYTPFGDVEATSSVIRRALGEGDGGRARDRIRTKFPVQAREATLTRVINELIGRETGGGPADDPSRVRGGTGPREPVSK